MAYREEPSREVVVGPLPIRLVHLVPAAMLAVVGMGVAALVVAGLVLGSAKTLVACSLGPAPGEVVTCEQKRDGRVTGRASAARSRIAVRSGGGRPPQRCLDVGDQFRSCGENSEAILTRIRALAPGQAFEVDNSTATPFMVIGLAGALSIALFSFATTHLAGTLRRRRRSRIVVTPRALEVASADGQVKVVPRVAGELVRVASVSTGRGGPAVACIAYGIPSDEARVVEIATSNGVVELAPSVEALHLALLAIPRAGF